MTSSERVVTPVSVSLFGRGLAGDAATLRWKVAGTDGTGSWVDPGIGGSRPVSPRRYSVDPQGVVEFTMPSGLRTAYLWVWLERDGRTLAENFTNLDSTDQRPPGPLALSFDPTAPIRTDWSQGSGTTRGDGPRSAWGQGTGVSEYAVELPADLDPAGVASATLTLEAAARRPPWPRTTFPQTSDEPFPTRLTVTVGGVPTPSVTLPDDPADSRGALSYANGPEPGQWGYRVVVPIDVQALRPALRPGGSLTIRLAGTDGGLTLLGPRTGRLGIAPSLTLGTDAFGAPQRPTVEAGPSALAQSPTSPYLRLAAPRLRPGEPAEIQARLTNPTTATLVQARLAALLPDTWSVTATSATSGDVAPGETLSATWRVVPPASGGSAGQLASGVAGQATFGPAGKRRRVEQSLANVLPPPRVSSPQGGLGPPASGSREPPAGSGARR